MGLLFRKRLRLGKFLSLNLSKSGAGLSVGPPGAKLSLNPKRARMQLGIPGTGLGYRRDVSVPTEPDTSPLPTSSPPSRPVVRPWLLVVMGLLLLAWWLGGCGFPAWRDQTLRDVAEGRWHADPEQMQGGSGTPSQTIEFRDAAGRNLGYGKVQGGTAEFFNPDGSRVGFGKVGR